MRTAGVNVQPHAVTGTDTGRSPRDKYNGVHRAPAVPYGVNSCAQASKQRNANPPPRGLHVGLRCRWMGDGWGPAADP